MKKVILLLAILAIGCKPKETQPEIINGVTIEEAIDPASLDSASNMIDSVILKKPRIWDSKSLKIGVGRVTSMDCAGANTENVNQIDNYVVIKNKGLHKVYRDVDVDTYLVLKVGDSIK